ncbi:MAG TPA: hypothetical protein VN918_02845 [Myxococcaceae bacterium]|nr:hypothetical protein [Myxococcaceae bacterium]
MPLVSVLLMGVWGTSAKSPVAIASPHVPLVIQKVGVVHSLPGITAAVGIPH